MIDASGELYGDLKDSDISGDWTADCPLGMRPMGLSIAAVYSRKQEEADGAMAERHAWPKLPDVSIV